MINFPHKIYTRIQHQSLYILLACFYRDHIQIRPRTHLFYHNKEIISTTLVLNLGELWLSTDKRPIYSHNFVSVNIQLNHYQTAPKCEQSSTHKIMQKLPSDHIPSKVPILCIKCTHYTISLVASLKTKTEALSCIYRKGL